MAFGTALLVAGHPAWMSAFAFGGGLAFLVAFLAFNHLPPFV